MIEEAALKRFVRFYRNIIVNNPIFFHFGFRQERVPDGAEIDIKVCTENVIATLGNEGFFNKKIEDVTNDQVDQRIHYSG